MAGNTGVPKNSLGWKVARGAPRLGAGPDALVALRAALLPHVWALHAGLQPIHHPAQRNVHEVTQEQLIRHQHH